MGLKKILAVFGHGYKYIAFRVETLLRWIGRATVGCIFYRETVGGKYAMLVIQF
jgi:hypothetical protein